MVIMIIYHGYNNPMNTAHKITGACYAWEHIIHGKTWHFCIHWLVLVCALTGDQTHNLGISGRYSNQLSYPARATWPYLYPDMPTLPG